MKRRSQISSKTPSPSPSSSSSHPSRNDKGTLEVKRTKEETSGSSGTVGAKTTVRCTLEEALECQVCLDVAASPIYSCNEGGHVLCYICHGKLAVPKKCPSCSSQGLQTNAALERQAQKLEFRMTCANVDAGCKEKVLSTDFKVHLETDCYFRDINCILEGCNSIFKFNEYETHLQQVHAEIDRPTVGVMRRFRIPIGILANPEALDEYVMTLSFDNKPFLLRMKRTDSTFHIWMVMIGDDKEAKQHFVKFGLFGKQKLPRDETLVSWTVPVIPFHDDPATQIEKTKPFFGTIGMEAVVSMVEKHGPHSWIDMKVELITMK